MRQSPFRARIALAGLVMLVCMAPATYAQTATLSVRALTGNDTLYVGLPGAVVISVEGYEGCLSSVNFFCKWSYDSGPAIDGQLPKDNPDFTHPGSVGFSYFSVGVLFDSHGGGGAHQSQVDMWSLYGSQPDHIYGPRWNGSGELFRFNLLPSQPRELAISIPTDLFQSGVPKDWDSAVILTNCKAERLKLSVITPAISIVPCDVGRLDGGDVNFDRVVDAIDIEFLASNVFMSGVDPVILNMGDTNCSGDITSADVILLVGYVFKSLAPPCDPCETVP